VSLTVVGLREETQPTRSAIALWKVIVVMQPGQNISDIDKSTKVIAVDMPNDGGEEGKIWQEYSLSVNTLEENLNQYDIDYDFFSNIQKDLRKELKNEGNIASLLASNNKFSSESLGVSFGTFDKNIGQSSLPQESIVEVTTTTRPTFGIPQISPNQDSRIQIVSVPNGSLEIGSSQIDPLHIGTSKVSFPCIGPVNSGITQISSSKIGSYQARIGQASPKQSGFRQVGQRKASSFEVSTTKIDSSQIDVSQVNSDSFIHAPTQFNSSEVSLPSSVPSQQFFSSDFPSHNSTPEIINALNNSPTSNDSFGGQIIEPEAIYGINSTNAPLTDIPDSRWVSSLNPQPTRSAIALV
jgi:hypothetical protein